MPDNKHSKKVYILDGGSLVIDRSQVLWQLALPLRPRGRQQVPDQRHHPGQHGGTAARQGPRAVRAPRLLRPVLRFPRHLLRADQRRLIVGGFHLDPTASVESLRRLKRLARTHDAQIYPSHEMAPFQSWKKAPSHYEG